VERDYRSLPLWLARAYLVDIGGNASDDGVRGADWSATLREGEPIAIGALRIGQIHIVFDGDAAALERVIAAFEKKALRAGGY
jgi:hypothetical protein